MCVPTIYPGLLLAGTVSSGTPDQTDPVGCLWHRRPPVRLVSCVAARRPLPMPGHRSRELPIPWLSRLVLGLVRGGRSTCHGGLAGPHVKQSHLSICLFEAHGSTRPST